MKIFCVTAFALTGENKYHPVMRYLGLDRAEAIRVASNGMEPWNEDLPTKVPNLFSSLPMTVERTVIRYYRVNNAWTSIEEIIFTEEN